MEIIKTNCIIIGGGVAGLAIGKKLSETIDNIYILEKDRYIGNSISSRNSEVIHAGIYYKPDSLKNKLIRKGKKLLYRYLEEKAIAFNRCGKFIVASSEEETGRLDLIRENAKESGLNDLFFDTKKFKKLYPFMKAEEAIFSPSTGIFDSHEYMLNLKMDFEKNGGHVLLNNKLLSITHNNNYLELLVKDKSSEPQFIIKTKLVINCAGLSAIDIHNMFPDVDKKFKNRFVKGEYYSYSGREKINHLIYPIPTKDSLGIHVTMDMGNRIRFGPSAYEVDEINYDILKDNKLSFAEDIKKYWPDLDISLLQPSYSGIRPKMHGYHDYNITTSELDDNIMFSILGYDSPGLSASLGLAEYINDMYSDYFMTY